MGTGNVPSVPPTLRQLTTLPAAYREFSGRLTPRLLVGELVLFALVRLWWSRWSVSDAVVFGVLVGMQPFTEWVIHAFVLHCPADQGLRDRLAGDSHRRHHQDPRDLRFQFIHPRAVYGGMVLNTVVVVATRTPAALTGVLTATLLTLVYEWVHFLIHTDYCRSMSSIAGATGHTACTTSAMRSIGSGSPVAPVTGS